MLMVVVVVQPRDHVGFLVFLSLQDFLRWREGKLAKMV